MDKFILASLDYPGINIAFDTTICYELDMFLFMAAVINLAVFITSTSAQTD